MSASSSVQHAAITALGFLPTSEKLTRDNYPLWRAQVLSSIKGAEVFHFLDTKAEAPPMYLPKKEGEDKEAAPILNKEYTTWVAKDQQVLSYLLVSLSREVLQQVSSATTAIEAWAGIEKFFASQLRARVISTRMALATASKGVLTIAGYYTKIKTLADEMASAGQRLEDDEIVSYMLMGLDEDYESVVSAVATRVEPITLGELYTQLIAHEQRLEMRSGGSNSSANSVSHGNRGNNDNNSNRGRGGFSHGGGDRN
jgi:hypothetical protein